MSGYISEFFGYRAEDDSNIALQNKAKQRCPFLSSFCTKALGDKNNRILLRVMIPSTNTEEGRAEDFETRRQVERLMGKDPEQRFRFIIERAKFVDNLDI